MATLGEVFRSLSLWTLKLHCVEVSKFIYKLREAKLEDVVNQGLYYRMLY